MFDANVLLDDSGEIRPLFEKMHFGAVPNSGDCVEVEGKAYTISKVVHTPSIYAAGTKLKVILRSM